MKKLFDEFIDTPEKSEISDREESPSPEKSSPGKDSNAGSRVKKFNVKGSEHGSHLGSPTPSPGRAASSGAGSSMYKK